MASSIVRRVVGLLLGAFALAAWAAAVEPKADFSHLLSDEPAFLKAEEAFQLQVARESENTILASWTIADGYYLYRHRFAIETRADSGAELGPMAIAAGKKKVDEYFGEVEVYYHDADVRVPVIAGGVGAFEVGVTYQGCADRGLCYPPRTEWVALSAVSADVAPASTGAGLAGVPDNAETGQPSKADPGQSPFDTGPVESGQSPNAITGIEPVGAAEQTREQALAGALSDSSLLWSLAIFFLAGVGLAFTPCVLPMVPILSSIIVGQGEAVTRGRALSLSAAYVTGMAATYAALGVLVGLFGASMNLQAALQSPIVLGTFALIFAGLALSMFGFFELRLPRFLQDRLDAASSRQRGGRHAGVVVMGALSALVVSPCVSAPLAGALIYLSTTGDAVLGGAALLALGFGMGVPLLIIGASGGHLLPRAGAWMDAVKAIFGVLLLAVSIWLLDRVIAAGVTMLLWAALAIGVGVYLGALDFSARKGWGQMWKAAGAFAFVCGVLLLVGAALGGRDPLAPLAPLAANRGHSPIDRPEHGEWGPVKGVVGLNAALDRARTAAKPVVLDFYADWCIACRVMERDVFVAPEVAQRLAAFERLRADVTRNDELDQALLESLGLFGPPSLVFFGPDGREITELRIQGEMNREDFVAHLDRVAARVARGAS
jgi:thiol:disulfide interchange protein DsbD